MYSVMKLRQPNLKIHATYDEAEAEARRLAGANPDMHEGYVILEQIAIARPQTPPVIVEQLKDSIQINDMQKNPNK